MQLVFKLFYDSGSLYTCFCLETLVFEHVSVMCLYMTFMISRIKQAGYCKYVYHIEILEMLHNYIGCILSPQLGELNFRSF